MASCNRRTLCSAKTLTGLVFGIVMGFVMGTIHLAVMNSQFVYTPGDEPLPCPINLLKSNKPRAEQSKIILDKHSPQLDMFQRQKKSKESQYNEMVPVNKKINDYNSYDDIEDDRGLDSFFQDKEIDKIYEIDISQIGLDREKENFRELHSSKKQTSKKKHENEPKFEIPASHGSPVIDDPMPDNGRNFLYVGVMTASKYVHTRGKAIVDTWGLKIPGKVELFVGETADLGHEKDLPVVQLKKVDDNAYPPQKKSFMMLKYMYDQYINGYEWFMRADDDAYVKSDKLEEFLRKLNSSEPLFIGQTGLGNEEERGKLTLNHGENYCMGGPGMIFSREVIRRIAPYIKQCLQNMYTIHEDVEISRCVSKYANVKCVWSYEMRELFYEHYSKRLGYIDPNEGSFGNNLIDAITLHPNKNPDYQRRLHNYFLSQKIKVLQSRLTKLYRAMVETDSVLDKTSDMEEVMLGSPLTLNRLRPTNGDDVLSWQFFSDRLYLPSSELRRNIPSYVQDAVKDIVLQVMGMMNRNSKVRGRVITFKRVSYGYMKVNPLFGSEYVLDLLLQYYRYRGKKVSLPVRRHAYLQQTFGRTEMHEDPNTDAARLVNKILQKSKEGILKSFISNPLNAIATFFKFKERSNHYQYDGKNFLQLYDQSEVAYEESYGVKNNLPSNNKIHRVNSRFTTGNDVITQLPTVNIIVPLSGRFLNFQRFLANLERVAFVRNDPVSLLVMLFMPYDQSDRTDMRLTQQLVDDYKMRYPEIDIRYFPVAGEFSRGLALEVGTSQFSADSLLFFCDVDVMFNIEFLRKCRMNTVQGQTVYYPVLFSEFNPAYGEMETKPNGERKNHYEINKDSGYWRSFGYGLLCVYQSDYASTGGFDTSIKGWGFEDVDLFSKFFQKLSKEISEHPVNTVKAKPVRVKEPDLIHVHHSSHCDPELASNKLTMCQQSRNSNVMSVSLLYYKWRKSNDKNFNKKLLSIESDISDDRDHSFYNKNRNISRKNVEGNR